MSDERREAFVDVLNRAGASWESERQDFVDAYDALLAHLDKHEPAVADALRYGLVTVGTEVYGTFVVDYPEDQL